MLARLRVWTALAALSLSFGLALAPAASARPVIGPSGLAFYDAPSSLPPGPPGTLVWYRPTTLNLDVALPSVNAWDVLYRSTDEQGAPDVVTGTVIAPTAAWTGSGTRPVVDYAIGTQGLAQSCAPSLQMVAGTEYDGGAVIAALKKGYAVVVTDYQGYTQDATPTYTAGAGEAHAVLDIERAARQIPGSGVFPWSPTILWGYSQGGQAASWAAELAPLYAPDIRLLGLATGGTPGDLQALATFDDGSVGSAFEIDSIIGLNAAYPGQIDLSSLVNAAGLAAEAKLESECAIQSLADFRDDAITQFSATGQTLTQIEQQIPAVQQIVNAQKLGTLPVRVPVYHYHALEDEFVPVTQDVTLHQQWCSLGVRDDFVLYPGDHLLTDPTAIPDVMSWIAARLAGQPAPLTCGLHAPGAALPSTARLTPETGDLVIPLPGWQVSGSVTSANIGLSLPIPAGTTLDGQGDITNGTFTANITFPPITDTVSVLGIPFTLDASLTPTAPAAGTVSLSDAGVLSIDGSGTAELTVNSIGIAGLFSIPLGCSTTSPVSLPLSVSDPVNALSAGAISIKADVTLPPFANCGILGPLISLVLSGPNNPLNLTAAPPPGIPF